MVADRGIDWWRSFFAESGSDIWSVIEQAMLLAAADYPSEFKDRRSEIGEVLFSRSLLDLHLRISPGTKCSEVTDSAANVTVAVAAAAAATDGDGCRADRISPSGRSAMTEIAQSSIARVDNGSILPPDHHSVVGRALLQIDDEAAEALSDQLEEEDAILRELYRIRDTMSDSDQPESVLFDALRRLQLMDVDVRLLQKTMIGREVTPLKKHSSERVSKLAKHLISHWKRLVQLYSAEMEKEVIMTTEADQTTENCAELPEAGNEVLLGLPEPPFDAGAFWASSTTEFSQLVNFMHEAGEHETPKDKLKLKPPLKSDAGYNTARDRCLSSSTSHSESLMTDSSDTDTGAAMEDQTKEFEEDRRSRIRAEKKEAEQKVMKSSSDQQENGASKEATVRSGPSKAKISAPKTKISGNGSKISDSKAQEIRPTSIDSKKSNRQDTKPERIQLDKKLEMAKRKLHQGYEEAEKAKKQRTIRVLDIPDLPKGGQNGVKAKANHHHHHQHHHKHVQQKTGHRIMNSIKQKLRR